MEKEEKTGIELIRHQAFVVEIRNICSDELNKLYEKVYPKYRFDKNNFIEWAIDKANIQENCPLGVKITQVLLSLNYYYAKNEPGWYISVNILDCLVTKYKEFVDEQMGKVMGYGEIFIKY